MAIKEYLTAMGDNQIDKIVISSIFSTRDPPKTREEVEVGNFMVPQLYELPLKNNLEGALDSTKKIFREQLDAATVRVV